MNIKLNYIKDNYNKNKCKKENKKCFKECMEQQNRKELLPKKIIKNN